MTGPSRRPRVVLWDTLPSPYGVEQFNTLAARGAIDLAVWYCRRTEPGRRWDVNEAEWRFAASVIEDPGRGPAETARFLQRCRRMAPELIVSPYGERAFVVGHALASGLGIPTVFLVQRTFDAWVQRTWWKELAKVVLFRSAHAAYVHGPDGHEYARRFGFPDERIFTVRQTTNVEHFGQRVSGDERDTLRARLGVDGCVFLYVGRFWKGKGLLYLLEAFRRVRRANAAVSLLLVGDGADERDLRRAAEGLEGVVFVPFVQAAELPEYYAAADVFVFPTLGDPHGQVIEEAHAARLPIVTTHAVGEVEQRVVNGVSGVVVPPADAAALAEPMLMLATSPEIRAAMGARGSERVTAWDHDVYACEMERLVDACLALPRRTSAPARAIAATGQLVGYVAGAVVATFQRQFS